MPLTCISLTPARPDANENVNDLVKILSRDDGEPVSRKEQVWCLSVVTAGSNATLCSGEFYGYGEGSATFKTKSVNRGGITCPECLARIKKIKAIRR